MIVWPIESAPTPEGVKLNVTDTPAMLVNRSEFLILKKTPETWPPCEMNPDGVLADGNGS